MTLTRPSVVVAVGLGLAVALSLYSRAASLSHAACDCSSQRVVFSPRDQPVVVDRRGSKPSAKTRPLEVPRASALREAAVVPISVGQAGTNAAAETERLAPSDCGDDATIGHVGVVIRAYPPQVVALAEERGKSMHAI